MPLKLSLMTFYRFFECRSWSELTKQFVYKNFWNTIQGQDYTCKDDDFIEIEKLSRDKQFKVNAALMTLCEFSDMIIT